MRLLDARCDRLAGSVRLTAACAVFGLLLAACTSTSEEALTANVAAPVELKVMEFNIEYGGHEVDFDSVIMTITKADADVVAIEEAWGNIPIIANRLGWGYFDVRTQIVSRYPLLAPPESDGLYTFVEVEPGRVVAIGNVHLPSAPYGPNKIRTGDDRGEILALEERVRLPAVEPFVVALSRLADQDIPVFLAGDFNAPSHRDWTAPAVGIRDHVEYQIEWPVSAAVEEAGFRDSYREIHPDPVQDPGLTWPAARPFVKGYNPARSGGAADRIDFVYAGGPGTTTDSVLVGERGAPDVEVAVAPWPTDHRGVLSTFEVTPSAVPTFVAVEQRAVEVGNEVRVSFQSARSEADRVDIVSTAGGAIADRSTGDGSSSHGKLTFSTEGWAPGAYEAVLTTADDDELSRISFWVQAPTAQPRIDTTESVYSLGESIEVEWRNAPGNRWDWVGIYERGADPNVASYITWFYTDSSIEGTKVMDDEADGRWPLPAGRYSMYLLEDDGYRVLARDGFTVRS